MLPTLLCWLRRLMPKSVSPTLRPDPSQDVPDARTKYSYIVSYRILWPRSLVWCLYNYHAHSLTFKIGHCPFFNSFVYYYCLLNSLSITSFTALITIADLNVSSLDVSPIPILLLWISFLANSPDLFTPLSVLSAAGKLLSWQRQHNARHHNIEPIIQPKDLEMTSQTQSTLQWVCWFDNRVLKHTASPTHLQERQEQERKIVRPKQHIMQYNIQSIQYWIYGYLGW